MPKGTNRLIVRQELAFRSLAGVNPKNLISF
jgi:hypothetical protein